MRVDEAGDDRGPARIDLDHVRGGADASAEIALGSNEDDTPGLHGHRGVPDHADVPETRGKPWPRAPEGREQARVANDGIGFGEFVAHDFKDA